MKTACDFPCDIELYLMLVFSKLLVCLVHLYNEIVISTIYISVSCSSFPILLLDELKQNLKLTIALLFANFK